MPEEFENVIMSKYKGMPVTLLLDRRHRNITDFQFESIKNYIRILVDKEEINDRTKQCDSCHQQYRLFYKQPTDITHAPCPHCEEGKLHDVTGHV